LRRTLRILTIVTFLVPTAALTAGAGAMAVASIDEVPSQLEAGATHVIGYSITAHGNPTDWAGGTALRFHGPDGETLTFDGVSDRKGHWNAEIELPNSGDWKWEVVMGTDIAQHLGDLTVAPPTVGPDTLASSAPSNQLLTLRIVLPIATVLAVAVLINQGLALRRREGGYPASDAV